MCVRQPGVQRRQADLGSVTEQQKNEGDVEQRGIERTGVRHQNAPDHGVEPLADHRTGRHVDEDRAKQGERYTDAAENEIFPRRFERLVGAVDSDYHHGGQRRQLDCHPHQSDVVCDQRQIHRKHQHLIHCMIEAHERRRQSADLKFVADIAGAEYAGSEADKAGQDDKGAVEIVDQQIRTGLRLGEQ